MAKIKIVYGNIVSIIFVAVAVYLSKVASIFPFLLRVLISLFCWYAMLYFTHCISHYIVGYILGVKFSHYFISKSMLSKAKIPLLSTLFSRKVFLGLKIKRKSSNFRMFLMFLAGPLASMFSPLVIVFNIYSYDKLIGFLLLILTMGNIIFTGYYSYKFGCIRKALNSLKGLDWKV